ncbi:hypothetical protein HDV04_002478 [Boothiomyces sp. JEL0838]|nr:hypothetical protein HDV04_002478 [Boothiomyces sp. JEL0838]
MPLYYFNPREYAPSPYELYQEQLRAGRYRQMQEQMYQERLRQAYLERLYEQKLQERLEQIYRQKAQEELEQLVEARVNQQLAKMGLYQPARQPVRQAVRQTVQPTDIYYYPQERKQPEYQVYLRAGQTTPTRCQPTHIPIEAKQEVPEPVKQEPQFVKIFVQPPQESQKECCGPKEKAKCCKAKCDSKYKCQKAKSARKASERNMDAVKSSINSVFDVIEHLMNQTQESQQESQKQEQQQPKQTSKPVKIHIEDKNEEPLSMIEKLRRNSEVLLEPKESLNKEVASDAENHEDIKDDASDTSNLSMIERLKVKSEAILEQEQDATPKEPEIPVEEIQIADVPDTEDTLVVEDQSAKVDETVTATEPQAESKDDSEKKVESDEHIEIQKPIEKHGSKDTLIEEKMEDLHIHSPRSTMSDTFEMVANV